MWLSSGLCMSFGMQLWPIKLKLYSWQRQRRHLHSQFDMLTRQASVVLVSQCCFHLDLKKSHHQRVSEFQRIRSIFGTSERQWVEAQVENAQQQAILMAPKSQVSSDEAHIHLDLHSLRRKHAELVGELSNSYHKEEKLLSEVCSRCYLHLRQLRKLY